MSEFCTCGAQLPPDARFCHKCGKPQREEPLAEIVLPASAPESPPASPLQAAPLPLSFRNPVAVRTGLLAAALLCLLMMIPGVNYAWILWLPGAGCFSVWIYKRRTGQRLTVTAGAGMGWITGVLSFAIVTILLTFCVISVQHMGIDILRERLRELSIQQDALDEFVRMLKNPFEMVWRLAIMFILMTLTTAAGGAIGAKILGKR